MPRKRATRVKTQAKPKRPENDIGNDLDPGERKRKLEVFLEDFNTEVNQRVQKMETYQLMLKAFIEKELNLQLRLIPLEVREMTVKDFHDAGGTVESALAHLHASRKDSTDSGSALQAALTAKKGTVKGKGKGLRKNRAATQSNTDMAPPSSAVTAVKKTTRSRLKTPMTKRIPDVWDTPMVTPKFDINLPFTPGLGRAPRHGERVMSLAGSPIEINTWVRVTNATKQKTIAEEEEGEEGVVEDSVSCLASAYEVPKTAIHDFLASFHAAKKQCDP